MVILNDSGLVKPVAYYDKLAVWLKRPASPTIISGLKARYGNRLHVGNQPSGFDRRYRQRLEFKQPDLETLRWIARQPGAYINQIEVALDWIFETVRGQDQMWDLFHCCLVRRWHGRKQDVRIHPGKKQTRYDAGRWAPNSLKVYKEDYSRITGEVNCLHVEWRATRGRSVRSAGIKSAKDLLSFDHREFWKKRLLLFTIDHERLGRQLRNKSRRARSRTAATKKFGRQVVNLDERAGWVLVSGLIRDDGTTTVQEVIDRYGSRFRLDGVLVPISVESLLPEGRFEVNCNDLKGLQANRGFSSVYYSDKGHRPAP